MLHTVHCLPLLSAYVCVCVCLCCPLQFGANFEFCSFLVNNTNFGQPEGLHWTESWATITANILCLPCYSSDEGWLPLALLWPRYSIFLLIIAQAFSEEVIKSITYIIVDKVTHVSVVGMDELSSWLHLSIHPWALVLWASFVVVISSLAMPGNEMTQRISYSHAFRFRV